jgi:hypothetical protein
MSPGIEVRRSAGRQRQQRRLTVWGSSRIRWLRRLARRPATTAAYAATGVGLAASVILAGGGLFSYAVGARALPLVADAFVLTALWTRRSVVLDGPAAYAWAPVQKAYLNAEPSGSSRRCANCCPATTRPRCCGTLGWTSRG